jgi:segregation and condensation protein B
MNITTDNGPRDPLEEKAMREPIEGTPDRSVEQATGDLNGQGRPPIPDDRDIKTLLEALLFVSQEPVTVERLCSALGGPSKADVRQALAQLQTELQEHGRGVQVVEIAGGFQLSTRPEHGPWIKQFCKSKSSPKLSRSGLETLAIIAYKQPIVRVEIEEIRGVETSGVLRTLLERKLVRIVGRKEVPGRPIMYGTTKLFLQHFGLRDLSELPPLREFRELGESDQTTFSTDEHSLRIGEAADPDPFVDCIASRSADEP